MELLKNGMSLMKKLNNNYKKLYNLYKRVNINRKVFLYSDSKGLSLKEFIPSNLKDKITVVTTVADRKLKDKLLELVEKSRDPIVLVWLGTCELTDKKGKYISIRH